MTAKKTSRGRSGASNPARSSAKKTTKRPANAEEMPGTGLSLADLSRVNAKYLQYESLEERTKEVERVKRFIIANLARTALGIMKSAEKGTNAAGAKLLWDFAELEQLPTLAAAPPDGTQAPTIESAPAGAGEAEDDDDPTKAVLSFYKKLGITPPRLKPPVPVMAAAEEAGTLV